jgi:hypothetical protein
MDGEWMERLRATKWTLGSLPGRETTTVVVDDDDDDDDVCAARADWVEK